MKKESFGLKKVKSHLISSVMWLETILAFFIIISVIISGKDLISFLIKIYSLDPISSYDMFQKLLSYLLLLVVGLELALMLVKHTPNSIVEVMLYAIARKMLIYGTSSSEVLLGVLSLALIFIIKKFLFSKRDKLLARKEASIEEFSMDLDDTDNIEY